MKVDYVLILAAGKGTRMGKIGESLPKVIWPIFEKSILELEVKYALEYAPQAKIYINLYNNKEKIIEHSEGREAFENVNFLIEEEELDIGGAVQNLASKVNYSGNVLVINSDQFLFLEKESIANGLILLSKCSSVLFTKKVRREQGYNGLEIKNNKFKKVIPNKDIPPETKEVETYTGMSLIDLSMLEKKSGKSNFFSTIAGRADQCVGVLFTGKNEYWDFGTTQRYYDSMVELTKEDKGKKSLFRSFLVKHSAIDPEKVSDLGYNSNRGINFSNTKNLNLYEKNIVIGKTSIKNFSNVECIILDETIQKINE